MDKAKTCRGSNQFAAENTVRLNGPAGSRQGARGQCQVCHRELAVTTNGYVARHNKPKH